MENSKHTGGEWKVIPYNGYQQCIGTTNYTIAHTTIALEEKDKIQAEANAKLMAAAPDLLKALDELQHEVQMQCSIGSDPRFLKMCELWQNAKQAINKATK